MSFTYVARKINLAFLLVHIFIDTVAIKHMLKAE